MASKAISKKVDEFIAHIAAVGSRCFDLNGHDGLTMEQQTSFFLLGRSSTFLVQRLTDRYNDLLVIATSTEGKASFKKGEDACATAIASCDAVVNAGAVPPIAVISNANSDAARALDVSDDVLSVPS